MNGCLRHAWARSSTAFKRVRFDLASRSAQRKTGDSLFRSLGTGFALVPSLGGGAPAFAFLFLRAVGLPAASAAAAALDSSAETGFAAASMEDFSAAGCRAMRRLRAGFLTTGLFVALSALLNRPGFTGE